MATTQRCIEEAAARAGVAVGDVDWVIPHHASANIVDDGVGQAGVPAERIVLSIDHTGNTSSASVPTALDEAARAGRFSDGERIILLALGGGMGWGSTLYRWRDPSLAIQGR